MNKKTEQDIKFSAYLKGNKKALSAVFQWEQPRLFDYLLRMTGDTPRSSSCVEEVIEALKATPQDWQNLSSLRISLYKTSRSFIADLWNNSAGDLENLKIKQRLDSKRLKLEQRLADIKLIEVDRALQSLHGSEREPIILMHRYDFSLKNAAKIMGMEPKSFDSAYRTAMAKLVKTGPLDLGTEEDFAECVNDLDLHPPPEVVHKFDTDLQELIVSIKKTRPPWRLMAIATAILVFAIALTVIWWQWPDLLISLVQWIQNEWLSKYF
jgi:DNA-directed RNA polymerase specialized sigma24 family protein